MTAKRFADYTWRDIVRVTAGVIMLILGLLGLVFPVLQGFLFLLLSAALLAPYSVTVQRWKAWSERRFPESHRRARRLKNKMTRRRGNGKRE